MFDASQYQRYKYCLQNARKDKPAANNSTETFFHMRSLKQEFFLTWHSMLHLRFVARYAITMGKGQAEKGFSGSAYQVVPRSRPPGWKATRPTRASCPGSCAIGTSLRGLTKVLVSSSQLKKI
jgi:hypothetical protein